MWTIQFKEKTKWNMVIPDSLVIVTGIWSTTWTGSISEMAHVIGVALHRWEFYQCWHIGYWTLYLFQLFAARINKWWWCCDWIAWIAWTYISLGLRGFRIFFFCKKRLLMTYCWFWWLYCLVCRLIDFLLVCIYVWFTVFCCTVDPFCWVYIWVGHLSTIR